MGSFSIWHWLIVLLALIVPIMAVGYARGSLIRSGFVVRFIGSFIASVFAYMIGEAGYTVAFLAVVVLNILTYRWTAMRLNDVRWSRWWALLWFLWPVGLVIAVVLCFKRTFAEDVSQVFD